MPPGSNRREPYDQPVNVAEVLVGLCGGVALSAASWWVLTHMVVPRIHFSDAVSVLPDPDYGGVRYRVKLRNRGPRDVIDLAVEARIRFPRRSRLRPHASRRSTAILRVPVSVDRLPQLKRRSNRVIHLYTHELDPELIPEELRSSLEERAEGSLEALLARFDGSYVQLQVLAFDAFSGARKYYESPKYYADFVRPGYFKGVRVVREEPGRSDPRLREALDRPEP
jgi:hypothetical protein